MFKAWSSREDRLVWNQEILFYLLGSVGHLKSLHPLHHVLGCSGDAGGHVLDDLGDPVHLGLDITIQWHGLGACGPTFTVLYWNPGLADSWEHNQ